MISIVIVSSLTAYTTFKLLHIFNQPYCYLLNRFVDKDGKVIRRGLYKTTDECYSVYLKNLSSREIEEINSHEVCHHLVKVQYDHFFKPRPLCVSCLGK